MTIWHDIRREFSNGNNLTKIIFINIGVYIFINLLIVLSWMFGSAQNSVVYSFVMKNISTYVSLPFLVQKPWTIITYMFTHEGFLHLLFNMLWLYWMGRIFIDMLNGKRFVAIYLLGGIAGLVFAIVSYYTIPVLHEQVLLGNPIPMIGASASVMAITAAVGTYFPTYSIHLLFFGKVQLKYIALFAVVIDILSIPQGNAGGHLAHLGGALFGFMWAYQIKKGTDISKWFMNILDFIITMTKPQPNVRVSYKHSDAKGEYVQYEEVKKRSNVSQEQIDAILDKIAKHGYDSLTAKEKEILFTMSNKK